MRKSRFFLSFFLLFFFFSNLAYGQQVEIRILHVNDFHGFAEPYKPLGSNEWVGGLSYLASRIKDLRGEEPSLLLSAGDMIQGNNWANLFQGQSVIEWMNEMRFDTMVVGNHEFDFGQKILKKRITEAKFPILGANVEGLRSLRPYIIKEIGGVRTAIIGVTTEDTPVTTHPRNVIGLKFLSPVNSVEKYFNELRGQSDILIVLSHLGHPADRVLAERIPGIDVVVGGHSHTRIKEPVRVGNTIIVQAWEHGKALGVLDLAIEGKKIIRYHGHLEEIKPETGREDQATAALMENYKKRMDAFLNEEIGAAEVELDGENVRRRETNLGDLVSDVMRSVSGADVTLINGGGIRTSIKKGIIRVRDVYSAFPFDSYIVAVRLTGKEIKDALEHGVSGVEEEEGRFPQVSGLSFKYSRSSRRGSRVKSVLIGGKPIDSGREYIVATNDFVAAGGDGYRSFEEAIRSRKDSTGSTMKSDRVVYSDSGRWLRDVLVDYLKEKKKIAPKIEGRIIEVQ